MREGASLFILIFQLTFYLTRPTCLTEIADLPRKSHNNNYIILFGVLLTQLTTEDLPHDFYMNFYINDISCRRNNSNDVKVQVEYSLKLHYFNTPP